MIKLITSFSSKWELTKERSIFHMDSKILYVSCSKVGFEKGLHVLSPTWETTNVLYEEVLCWIVIVRT
jgi:hypothetical protein